MTVFTYREGEDMRKKLVFSVLIALAAALLACALYLPISAGGESNGQITVEYYQRTLRRSSETHNAGEPFTLHTSGYTSTSGKTFFGWFTEDGVLYAPGSTCSFDKDTKLYEAYGKSVSDSSSFQTSVKSNWNYTQLASNITTGDIGFDDGSVGIIDLNGHTLTITTGDDAFSGKSLGIIILGQGTLEVKSSKTAAGSAVFSNRNNTSATCGIRIGKNAKVISNAGLGESYDSKEGPLGYPVYDIYGTVEAFSALCSSKLSGTQSAKFNIYEGAKVKFTSDYLFYTSSDCTASTTVPYVDINIYGGEIITKDGCKFFDNPELYYITVTGGSFSSVHSGILTSDYRLTYNDTTKFYDVVYSPCTSSDAVNGEHQYKATGYTVTCEEAGTITYRCSLCNEEYVEPHSALGHQMFSALTAHAVTTKEATEPGYYTNTCIRCGYSYKEYFYPDPAQVYVNVRVRYQKGTKTVEETIRVPSKNMFSFDGTVLRLYDFQTITYEYPDGKTMDFRMNNVVGLEIPLGTTAVYGKYKNFGGDKGEMIYGAFRNERYIEELTIPGSVTDVYLYAFSNMVKIKKINGIENITGSIGEHAFEQEESSELYFDTLTLNAASIGKYAFCNAGMLRVYFSKSVQTIYDHAFYSTSKEKNDGVKEVFIEKNNSETALEEGNGTTVQNLQTKHRVFSSYDNNGQSYFAAANVFYDHEYEVTTVAPICVENGYDLHTCKNCGYSYKDNEVAKTGVHDFGDTPYEVVKSTCSVQGHELYKCSMCDETYEKPLPRDYSNHDYTHAKKYVDLDGNEVHPCEELHFTVGVCECGEEQSTEDLELELPLGHDYSILVDKKPSNCGVNGYEIYKCSYCENENKTELPLAGRHRTVKDEEKSKPATCASDGEIVYTCEVCGLVINTVKVDKDPEAHSWDAGKVIEEATSSQTGKIRYECQYCHATRIVSTPRTNSDKMPVWLIVVMAAGGALLLGGIGLTLYFTLFKKKNASLKYKYKFNTLGKK